MEAAALAVTTDSVVVCKLDTALDFRSAQNFKTVWETLIDTGKRNFILDLSSTQVLDSTGLGSIISLYRRVRGMGGKVLLAAPSPSVGFVLDLTQCHRVLGNYASVEAALAHLN